MLLVALSCYAQPGANDPTFNPGDQGFGFGDGANHFVYSTAIQSDGKIIIGGDFTSYNGSGRNHIARLNVDGSLDASFDPGTGADITIFTTAIQGDGKIIIGGGFSIYDGTAINNIARLNVDGSLDTSFDPGIGPNSNVMTTVLQNDGKIIIGGGFTSYNGMTINRIARLNVDGSLDTSFDPGIGPVSWVLTTAVQNDGKIIIGGSFNSFNGMAINHIARLNSDGSLDASFSQGSGANSDVFTTVIQSDGKIIIGGYFTSYNGTSSKRIARLNINGNLDSLFTPGTGADSTIHTMALQIDGKIIVGGNFTSYNGTVINQIARLNADGTLDGAFVPATGANYDVRTSALQSDGKIILGGGYPIYNGATRNNLVRLNIDGSLDTTFNQGTGANDGVSTTAIQSDGKIIVVGGFTNYNGISRNYIARLNVDGSLDVSFQPGTGANAKIMTMTIQSDGKIIIGGEFTSYNGTTANHIARLNVDGSLDTSFISGTGANDRIFTTSLQSDGKIIIGGDFTSYNGIGRKRIARLNMDASLDVSFNIGNGANSTVFTSSIQDDGKIIIGGYFLHYNGANIEKIARIKSDGSLDSSFQPGSLGGGDFVLTTAIQADGKIIVGGSFSSFNGNIARLNIDGSLDTLFNPGTGFDYQVNTLDIQIDSKIIVGGGFSSYDGTSRNGIARLNYDGSLDAVFNPGAGTGGAILSGISSASIQSDGKIIIGGGFTSFDGTGRNRVARILVSPLEIPSTQVEDGISIYPVPFSNEFVIEIDRNHEKLNFDILNTLGQVVLNGNVVEKTRVQTSQLAPGVYFVKIEKEKSIIVKRLIKE